MPDLGGTKPLVELVGYSRALEICATGRWVGAAGGRCDRAGHRSSYRLATLDAATARPGRRVARGPAGAVRATKGLLRGAGGRSYDEQRAAERAAQAGRLRDLAKGI